MLRGQGTLARMIINSFGSKEQCKMIRSTLRYIVQKYDPDKDIFDYIRPGSSEMLAMELLASAGIIEIVSEWQASWNKELLRPEVEDWEVGAIHWEVRLTEIGKELILQLFPKIARKIGKKK